tara:strand:- start:1355 stop:2080 length:726 start_codon:yes stop_codon:yes gene_type:complete
MNRVYLIKIFQIKINLKNNFFLGAIFLLTPTYSEDFWTRAMRLHYEHRVSFFNSIKIKEGSKIFIGDSITEQCNWNELFNDALIVNRGIGGDITSGVFKRLNFLKDCKPSSIFLMIGTNNLGQGNNPKEIYKEYRQIVEKILELAPESDLYIQSILPINQKLFSMPRPNYTNDKINFLNSLLKKIEHNKVKYLDLNKYFQDVDGNLDKNFSSDGLHLNGLGYQNWKKYLQNKNIVKSVLSR